MTQIISPEELKKELATNGSDVLILDVRTKAEFVEAHIAGSENICLSDFKGSEDILKKYSKIAVVCKGGVRAKTACCKIPEEISHKAYVLDGGVDSWIAKNFDVIRLRKRKISVMQQVQLSIGLANVVGAGLALTVSSSFAFIPLFTGLGLVMAGTTGFCPLARLIAKMPWNK